MKRKNRRRLWIIVAMLLLGIVLMSGGSAYLLRGTPDWYLPQEGTAEQRHAAARSAEDKLLMARNWAAQTQAQESAAIRAARTGATAPAPRPGAISISLTQHELNAFLDKWVGLYADQQHGGQAPGRLSEQSDDCPEGRPADSGRRIEAVAGASGERALPAQVE